MQKIPTLLVRDAEDRRFVTDEVTPGCEWVLAGEGVPTRKFDGTCVMLDEAGVWWARREVKPGKAAPPNWVALGLDEVTGKRVGWEPVEQSGFAKFHQEALENELLSHAISRFHLPPGTYELLGPKINGNPEGISDHHLTYHDYATRIDLLMPSDPPWTVDEVKHMASWCGERGWEGIVWHHPDGRMAKLKARDIRAEKPTG